MKIRRFSLPGILSLLACATAFAVPPLPPQNVRPAWLSAPYPDPAPFVQWELSSGADSYNVYRADDTNTAWALVATNITAPFYFDPVFSFLPSYYFVTAVNVDGESEPSAPTTVIEQYGGTIWALEIRIDYGTLTATNARVVWSTSWIGGDEGLVEWGQATGEATNFTSYLVNTNYQSQQQFVLTNLLPLTEYNYRVTSVSQTRGGVRWTSSFMTPDTNHPPLVSYVLVWNANGTNLIYQITMTDSDPLFCCPYPTNSIRILTAPTNGTIPYLTPFWGDPRQWYLTYVPDSFARGEDRFTFVVNDGELDSAPSTIVVSNWMNAVPTAGWMTIQGIEDTPVAFTLNNFDPDGDPVTFAFPWISGGIVSGTAPNFTFTPNPNVNGVGWVSYEVSDGYGTNYGVVEIHLASVNDRPVVDPLNATIWEDSTAYLYPTFMDGDGSGSYYSEVVTQPAHGMVTTFGFELIYSPDPDFVGTDTFTYAVVEFDGTRSDPATATITVTPVNDYPVPQSQTILVAESTPVNFSLFATDVDGDALTYWVNSGPFNGILTGTAPNFTYTPNTNFFGYETINFSAYDGHESRQGIITIGVGANSLPQPSLRRRTFQDGIVHLWWNALPGAQYFNLYRADGSNAPFTLLAASVVSTNFDDTTAVWQQPYWYRIRSWDGTNEGQPSNPVFAYPDYTGVLTLNQQNWLIRGTTGSVSFYSSIIGGTEGIFEYGTNRDYGTFLENTNILPSQVFNLSNLTPATVYYFRITATDVKGNAIVASTNLAQDWFVTESRPIANAQSVSTAEDNLVNIVLTGSDPNYMFHPITYALVSGVVHGTLTATGPNTYRYLPATNYNGADSFTFKVNNGELDSVPATVTITVSPVNDVPLAFNQSMVTGEDTSTNLTLTGSDMEGGPLTFQILAAPAHGTLSGTPPNVMYRPTTNYFGADSFTFTIFDPQFASATGTVSLSITNINDRPIATPQSLTTPEDTPLLVNVTGTDVEGDPLTLLVLALPTHGTLSSLTPTNVLYTPATNYNGPDSFTFRVSDGKLISSSSATVSITVTAVNDVPIANAQSVSTPEDTLRAITLSGTDVEGSALSYSIASAPAHGTVSGTGANRTYSPAANYFGADSFSFVVNDGTTNSVPATVSITVTAVNDVPVANSQSVTVPEDGSVSITPTGSDADPEGLTFVITSTPAHGGIMTLGPTTWIYTPVANYNGSDSFTFIVHDNVTSSAPATISITVTPVNDAPSTNPQSVTTDEDAPIVITLTGSDIDGSPLTYSVVSGPTNGTVSGTPPNVIYTPGMNFNGADSFRFAASDGQLSGTAVVNITVLPMNDAPSANAQSVFVEEEAQTGITLTANDVDGDALNYAVLSGPAHGTLSGTAPNLTYLPDAFFNGSDSLTFSVTDGTLSGTNVVSITVYAMNDAPIANTQSLSTDEDNSLAITLTGNDPDGDVLTYSVLAPPTHGTLSGTGANLTYTPDPNFHGNDSFTFVASDGIANATAYVVIAVLPVNDAPVALPQSTASVDEDSFLAVTLTGTDVDGDALTFALVAPPAHGTLSGTLPNLTYTPEANFNGADSFSFKANDGLVDGNTASISITVHAVNDVPTATNLMATTDEETPVTIAPAGADLDGDSVSFTLVAPVPQFGTVDFDGTNFVYSPATNFVGVDVFHYAATDGQVTGAVASITVTVRPVNDAPVANDLSVTLPEDASQNITLTGSDVEGDALSFAVVNGPAHGTLSGTGSNLTYTPQANFHGNDSFTFQVTDGMADGNVATVNILVTAVNDPPVANTQNVTLAEDTVRSIVLTGTDVDDDALSFAIVSGPAHGSLTGTPPNLVYAPTLNYNGPDSFTFTVSDGTATSAPATVSLNVTPVNDAPVATAQSRFVPEDTPTATTLMATDVDGDTLTFSVVTSPSHGTLSGTGANLTYRPATNYNGTDSFTYRATDPSGTSGDALFSLTVTPSNDRPIGTDQTVDVVEDTPRWFVPTATDGDGDPIGFVLIQPLHGTAVSTNEGILYTPNTNYFGNDILYYYPTDAISTGALTVVLFDITNVNDAPIAHDRTVTTAEDAAANFALGGSDPDNDALTFVIVSGPSHGTLSGTGANRAYTPSANYNGPDSFTFLVNDGTTTSGTATVNITVTPVNDVPSIMSYAAVTDEDTPLTFSMTASDVDNDPLTYIIVSNPSHGTLSGSGPTFTYTPALNYNGSDSFTFKVSDGTTNSGLAIGNFTIRAVNDAPIANAQVVSATEDTAVAITLTGSDVDGDSLTYTALSNPAHGTLSGTPINISSTNANFTYTPANNYNGSDSFAFKINDGRTNSIVATVTINVAAVNDAPVANAQSVTVTYNTSRAITLTGWDLEGSALTYAVVAAPTNGTLTGTAPNLTYTPTVGSAGADSFTFQVNDGTDDSTPATVSITTQNPSSTPTAPSSLQVTVPNAPGTLNLSWNDNASNEDGYRIERSLSSNNNWSQIATVGINVRTYTNSGLASKTTYYYRVRAYNRLGDSAYSNTANGKTR